MREGAPVRKLLLILAMGGMAVLSISIAAPSSAGASTKHKTAHAAKSHRTKEKKGSKSSSSGGVNKPGVGPNGLTSAQACGLVTPSQVQGLLGGTAPQGAGNPDADNLGSATCVWATANGENNSLSVAKNPGSSGCNGLTGNGIYTLRVSGWSGCFDQAYGQLTAYKGAYYLSFSPDLGDSVPAGLEATMESVATQIFAKLHA
jgi:hypothetical protein